VSNSDEGDYVAENPNKRHVVLIGCGAQAKFVIETLKRRDTVVTHILDPIGSKIGETIGDLTIKEYDLSVLKELQREKEEKVCTVICLSDNRLKKQIFNEVEEVSDFMNVIHPDCTVATSTNMQRGVIINPRAVIDPNVRIGDGVMIHSGVVVGHDCCLEDFVNIAPLVALTGGVVIGEGTTLFAGSVVAPNVKIGKFCEIGAGSVVHRDIPDQVLALGNPSRTIARLDKWRGLSR